uniref:EGF-like repeats and discoidin I-like domains 3a n=1 Tax=Astyanax mexicanus TaxID=7994 RepID=A0A8B9J8I0_ASTMX
TDLVANYSCECPGEYMGRNCQYKCSGPLGMEGGIISNQQITASSTHRALFGLQKWYPYFARLNKKGLVNAWTRQSSLFILQSSSFLSCWKVFSFVLSLDNRHYLSCCKIFRGNVDNNTPSANSFTPPIEAQYVRIYPQVCRRHCTLRMELLGCELTANYKLFNSAGCSEPLGMKSGHIQDYQITASSIFRTLNMDMFTWEPGKARLDKQGKVNAWTAGHSDQSQWLQVLSPLKIQYVQKITFKGVFTPGVAFYGPNQLMSFKRFILVSVSVLSQVFQGNFDNDTHRKNVIDPPIYARFIRILPWSWYGRITLRAELLGCTEEE